MSSRLDNRPQKDINEILKIVQFFKTECVKPGLKIGDKSCISFSAFSEKTAATIDINTIKNIGEKQRFINSTAEYQNRGLNKQITNFNSAVKNVYATTLYFHDWQQAGNCIKAHANDYGVCLGSKLSCI